MAEGTGKSRIRIIPAKGRTARTEENPDGEKKRIAVYARVSTDSEMQSSSYDLQVEHYRDYVNNNPNWILVDIYADEGISGTSTKNRAAFNRLIEDCTAGKIDYVLTKSISRFARNTIDCISSLRMLKQLKPPVGVYFEKENIDTLDNKSELFLTILSSMAQEESRSISENTKWGVQKRFQQGIVHMPTTYFLGYDTTPEGEIVIDEDQAAIVRQIFDAYLEGMSTPAIARSLMADGLKTARGNAHWTSDSVYKLLKNEKYTGNCRCQKTVTVDFLTGKRVRNHDIQPQYFVKNTHDAIISDEQFEKVQQEMKRRSLMKHDPDRKYRQNFSQTSVFSNFFFCGECGHPVVRRRLTSTKNNEKQLFSAWQCRVPTRKDRYDGDCRAQYVREEALERGFMTIIQACKEDKEALIEETRARIADVTLSDEEQTRLDELKTQIDAITDRISSLAAKESSGSEAIYDASLRHLIYEQEILQQECDHLQESQQEQLFYEDHLTTFLTDLEALDDVTTFDGRFFKRHVERGIIYNGHDVEFQFKCGLKRTLLCKRN